MDHDKVKIYTIDSLSDEIIYDLLNNPAIKESKLFIEKYISESSLSENEKKDFLDGMNSMLYSIYFPTDKWDNDIPIPNKRRMIQITEDIFENPELFITIMGESEIYKDALESIKSGSSEYAIQRMFDLVNSNRSEMTMFNLGAAWTVICKEANII